MKKFRHKQFTNFDVLLETFSRYAKPKYNPCENDKATTKRHE